MAGVDVTVIGAGLAGLACARMLADAGLGVRVLDKGRGLGGRLATRRFEGGQADHGAPAVHPRPDTCPDTYPGAPGAEAGAFALWLAAARQAGAAAWWPEGGGHVGLPGMSRLIAPLARGLDITNEAEVAAIAPISGGGWHVTLTDGQAATSSRLVLAIPQPQALRLLAPLPDLAATIAPARMRPQWVAIAAFATALPTTLTLARWAGGALAAARREGARPGRTPGLDTWVIEASDDWTRANLECDKPQAAALLTAALGAALGLAGPLPPTAYSAGHRWRHARTDRALGRPFVLDAVTGLGICGDWCLGPEAGAAFDSGRALAQALLR
jgi:renalase